MAPGSTKFIIVSSNRNKNRSQREKELEDAFVRSHAAKISHQRRMIAQQHVSARSELTLTRRCQCNQRSLCAVCRNTGSLSNPGKAQPWPEYTGSQDPFASSAVSEIQAICHKALDYGLSSTLPFSFTCVFWTTILI
jgi:hypothetical protein